MSGQVLLIEDDDALRASLAQTIELGGLTPLPMMSYVQARRNIRANFAGVILSDIRMPHQDGFDVLRTARAADPDLPVILLTGHSNVPTAMRAMKEGAWDYLEKPCSPDLLVEVLTRALSHRALVLRSRRIERALMRNDPAAAHFPGRDAASEGLRTALRAVAHSRTHVHLWGKEGTGRRQAGFVINQLSPEECPLRRIDLTGAEGLDRLTLPDGSVDLVCRHGHESAARRVHALVRLAEQHEGLRLITLANRPIGELGWRDAMEESGEGPPVIEIEVPSLDTRRQGLAEIFETLVRQVVRTLNMDMPEIPETLLAEVMTRSWPGNLPELRNHATSFVLGQATHLAAPNGQTLSEQVEAFEKLVISETLKRTRGNAMEAANALGLARNTFYDRLARYGLAPKSFRQ